MRGRFPRAAWGVLAAGFAASTLVLTGIFGDMSPAFASSGPRQLLLLYFFPTAGALIVRLITGVSRGGSHPLRCVETDGRAVEEILFWTVCFVTAIHIMVLAALTHATWVGRIGPRMVMVVAGVTTILVGNVLPKTRPNLAFGVRTAATLGDRRLWITVHRAAGYLTVVLGVLTVWAGLFLHVRNMAAVPAICFVGGAVLLMQWYRNGRRAAHM